MLDVRHGVELMTRAQSLSCQDSERVKGGNETTHLFVEVVANAHASVSSSSKPGRGLPHPTSHVLCCWGDRAAQRRCQLHEKAREVQ
jgi:hypothetical protein